MSPSPSRKRVAAPSSPRKSKSTAAQAATQAAAQPVPAQPAAAAPARPRSLEHRALKASEQVVHAILADIKRQGLKPGDRLPQEPEMVARYGVARATVREALRILEVNGLINVKVGPGGGPTVRAATPADFGRAISLFLQADGITLEELFRARRLVEPVLARDAALQQDPAWIAQARDLIARGHALDVADDAAYIRITREFHELTVAGATNRVFRTFALGLMSLFIGSLDRAIYPLEKRRKVLQEHEDILKAIVAGNATRVEKLMTAHMGGVQESIASRYRASYRDEVGWL